MPVLTQGFVRYRKHQFGRQSDHGTKVAATRAYPFTSVPDVNLNWVHSEGDTGTIVRTTAPHREKPELSFPGELPVVHYNNLPLLYSAFFGNAVSPTGAGAAQTWTFFPDAETPEDFDRYTYQFGDDVLTDWYQLGDGVLRSFEISGPDGLGALSATTDWLFGSVASTGSTDSPVTGTVPTAGLSVAKNDAVVYLKDLGIYIASSEAGLAAGQIVNALHNFTLRFEQEIDEKAFANGDQSFDTDAYGRGLITVSLEAVFAKTDDTVGTGSESDAWMSDQAVDRYVRLNTTSTVVAEEGTPDVPYSWLHEMPMRYMTREEGEINGNTTIVLTGEAFFDPDDFEGYLRSTIVNTLTDGQLGSIAS